MSIDERLRSGFAAQARTIQPDLDSRLAATLRRHRRRRAARWSAAALALAAACTAIVLAVVLGARRAEPALPAHGASSSAGSPSATYAGPGIPAGTWVRTIKQTDLSRGPGADLPIAFLISNYLDDGAGTFSLKIVGDRWTIYVEDDSGGLEVGDWGQVRYDAQGRWLQALNNGAGDPARGLRIGWSISGDTLLLEGPVGVDGHTPNVGQKFVLSGQWRRQS